MLRPRTAGARPSSACNLASWSSFWPRMTWLGMLTWLSSSTWTSIACEPTARGPIERAEFGVFFGGQVQERVEVPFELDASKQTLGFVLRLSQPLPQATLLHWEISKPGPLTPSRLPDPLNRRVELFDATIGVGQREIQKTVHLEPGDGLGLWNIRVTLGDQLAIDRAFMVFDPAARVTKTRDRRPVDAGL